MLALQGSASPHMLAVMGQSANSLFATVNEQLLRIFAAAEAVAAAGGGQPPSRGAKYALNIMLQVGALPGLKLVAGCVRALFGRRRTKRCGWVQALSQDCAAPATCPRHAPPAYTPPSTTLPPTFSPLGPLLPAPPACRA